MDNQKQGSLVIVGSGISVAGQMTLVSENYIKQAEIIVAAVPNTARLDYVKKLNSNVICLLDLYDEGKSRATTYKEMQQTIVDQVEAGKKVVAVFYGHPGIFVRASHLAVMELREKGYPAHMEPGISAEDCLVADLNLDPARYGCQSYETTQFMFRKYLLDPHQMQIFWQVGYAGEHTLLTSKANKDNKGLTVLTDYLLKFYPADHEVIIYEASAFPIFEPRIDRMPLKDLPDSKPSEISTLVIPGLGLPDYDHDTLEALGITVDEVVAAHKNV